MGAVSSIVYHGTTIVYMRKYNCSSVLEICTGPHISLGRHVINFHFGKSQLNENYLLLKAYRHVAFQYPKRKTISADTRNSTKVCIATTLVCGIILRWC
jgi:hypothetical protein